MRQLVVFNSVTLDGVMQAPGRPDEDRRGGFDAGGWSRPYQDEVMGSIAAKGMARGGPLLFGRWTYENFYSYWPHQTDSPFTEVLNRARKYVVSRTLSDPLPWHNSILLRGEGEDTVRDLKAEEGQDLLLMGSGRLLETLIRYQLVDRYVLLIHPVVLGSGRRLFGEGLRTELRLDEVTPTSTGVIIATYSRGD